MSPEEIADSTFRELEAALDRVKERRRLSERLFGSVAAVFLEIHRDSKRRSQPFTWLDVFPDPSVPQKQMSGEEMKLVAEAMDEALKGLGYGSKMADGLKDLTEYDKYLRSWKPGMSRVQ